MDRTAAHDTITPSLLATLAPLGLQDVHPGGGFLPSRLLFPLYFLGSLSTLSHEELHICLPTHSQCPHQGLEKKIPSTQQLLNSLLPAQLP